jgi:NADPH-dependent 2,4-dienoyl-CoA reductase/sulfur reductase-like enzyme
MTSYDTTDPAVQNYIAQVIEGVHSMGSLVSAGSLRGADVVTLAKQLVDQGVDVVTMGPRDLSNPMAIDAAVKQMEAVKRATGLIITMYLTIQHPHIRPETSDSFTRTCPSLDLAIKAVKACDGLIDIFQLRPATAIGMHPTGWNQETSTPHALYMSKAIRDSGAKVLLAPNGGFQNLDLNEEFIASGQCDMITMSRAWHADPEYGLKIYEGRGEDVVPCILCNRCHGPGFAGPWYAACSVNPKIGLESTVKAIYPPTTPKKVAVIGGGPGGMKAAITAAERGHSVTLYEKNGYLGGLLHHSDFSSYKWPLKNYKDYLVRNVEKTGVQVLLNTEATPEMIRAKGYDAVIAALGAAPTMTRIPGFDGDNVYNVMDVYEKEKELGKNIVFIGGGEYGVETAMFLAKAGHKTTILTNAKTLMKVERVHYPEYIVDAYDYLDNFYYLLEVTPKRISKGKVTYTDTDGKEKSIKADSVVIYAGLKARQDDALAFSDSAGSAFHIIGDCTGRGGDVQKVTRSAYFAAAQI